MTESSAPFPVVDIPATAVELPATATAVEAAEMEASAADPAGVGPAPAGAAGAARVGVGTVDYAGGIGVTPGNLKSRAVIGAVWTTGGFAVQQVMRLATNLVLTRLLSPGMFGLMSLVNVFIQGLQQFSDVGIGPSIIQSKRGDDPAFLNTAWTIQVVRGFALGAMSATIAWPVAKLYDERMLVWLLPAAGLGAVIAGFNSTALFTLNRHLEVGKLTVRSVVGQLVGAAVMIGWALLHRSVWALLAGNLAAAVAALIFSNTLLPGVRNYFHWDRTAAREMTRFGRWIFVSTVLTFLALEADRFIFGKLVTMAELGVYGVATMLAALPTTAVQRLGGTVIFPALSRAHADGKNFQRVFDRVRMPLLAGSGLVSAGLLAGGNHLIEFLYDKRYYAGGWMLQLSAVSGWVQVLHVMSGSALLAMGSPRSVAAGNVVKLVTLVVCIPLGYHWTRDWGVYSLLGPVWGIILSDVLKQIVLAFSVRRRGLHMGLRNTLLTVLVLASAAAAWPAGNAVRAHVAKPAAGKLLAMAVVAAVCGIIWAPVLYRSLKDRKATAA